MARPRKPASQRRTRSLTIWLTPGEMEQLRARATAAGVPLTAWARAGALRRRRLGPAPRRLEAEARVEFLRQGQNLNQIARALNAVVLGGGALPGGVRSAVREARAAWDSLSDLIDGPRREP